MAELESQLPGTMLSCLQEQIARIDGLQQDIDRLEARIAAWQKQDAACRAIADVPGIGRLTASFRHMRGRQTYSRCLHDRGDNYLDARRTDARAA